MHIFRLMQILKQILCYWLPIIVVLVIFILGVSVLLEASNETNTTFNTENDNQTKPKYYAPHDFDDGWTDHTVIAFYAVLAFMLLVSLGAFIFIFFKESIQEFCRNRRRVMPGVIYTINERVVIPEMQQQQSPEN